MQVSIAAIITAAGSSSRFLHQALKLATPNGTAVHHRIGAVKKEYMPLHPGDKPLTVLGAAVNAFASCPRIGHIVITVPATENAENAARASLPAELLADGQNRIHFVPGGPTRRASVHNALSFLESRFPSHVLIHDGARPWIKKAHIENIIDTTIQYGAVIPALPLTDTPKEVSPELQEFPGVRSIKRHLRRAGLCAAQTPQGFRFPEILRAHEKAGEREKSENFQYTDDAEVWGEFIGPVVVVPGIPENRKITYPEDLHSYEKTAAEKAGGLKKEMHVQRIGLGRDLHRLVAGRRFLLGGVEIPHEKGELGHSDGDVLVHAVIDAILGASGLGDIGELYPPNDPAWKDADSLKLLKGAWDKARAEGWNLINLDCTVVCEEPKIFPHRDSIRISLSQALEIDIGSVFVKGKTNEGLGDLGSGEAVEALAVCLLERPRAAAEPRIKTA